MAKSSGKSTAKKSSRSKGRKGKPSIMPDVDPPIIIKSGALPGDPPSMEMSCKDVMNFTSEPGPGIARPNKYTYPGGALGVISEISITQGSETCSIKVGEEGWQITFFPG